MRTFKMILVMAMLLTLGCGGSTALRSGKTYFSQHRDYASAEKQLRMAVEQEPDNWDAYHYLAMALAEQEKYAAAESAFVRARELAPEAKKEMVLQNQRSYFGTHLNQGLSALDLFDYETAIEEFQVAITIYPEDVRAYNNLGVAYTKMARALEKRKPAGDEKVAETLRGYEEKALKAFTQAVQIDSTSVSAWNNLANSYTVLGEYQLAKEAFEKVISLAPDDAEAMLRLGNTYLNEKDFEKALEYYDKAADKLGDDPLLHYHRGVCCLGLEKYREAAEAFVEAARLSENQDPELYRDAMYDLSVAYLQLAEYDMALATLQRLLEIEETAEIHDLMGRAYARQGRQDKALEAFRRAEELRSE